VRSSGELALISLDQRWHYVCRQRRQARGVPGQQHGRPLPWRDVLRPAVPSRPRWSTWVPPSAVSLHGLGELA